jgi:hypothetical protein
LHQDGVGVAGQENDPGGTPGSFDAVAWFD